MRQTRVLQRILTLTLGASAIVWMFAVTCPRCHDEAVSSDSDQIYQLSWIVDDCFATPPSLPTILPRAILIRIAVIQTVSAPSHVRVARLATSRAPPIS